MKDYRFWVQKHVKVHTILENKSRKVGWGIWQIEAIIHNDTRSKTKEIVLM